MFQISSRNSAHTSEASAEEEEDEEEEEEEATQQAGKELFCVTCEILVCIKGLK